MERPREDERPRPEPPDVVVRENRCPYCHTNVRPSESEWVACGRCLARSHSECWDESPSCAACGCEGRLVPESAPGSLALLGILTGGALGASCYLLEPILMTLHSLGAGFASFSTVFGVFLLTLATLLLPIVLAFLVQQRVCRVKSLRRNRRLWAVTAFVLAALVTPPDPLTQLVLALPLVLLYELGIWLACRVSGNRSFSRENSTEERSRRPLTRRRFLQAGASASLGLWLGSLKVFAGNEEDPDSPEKSEKG